VWFQTRPSPYLCKYTVGLQHIMQIRDSPEHTDWMNQPWVKGCCTNDLVILHFEEE